jgi:chemotaxis protein CheD
VSQAFAIRRDVEGTIITVGIGGLEVSPDPEALLVTHALGSCIAVIAWDAPRRIGGMVHFQLPASSLAPSRARSEPGAFADTGIPRLFERMYAHGARKPDLVVKVAGGGSFHPLGTDVGQRNQEMMRRILADCHVGISAEDLGGSRSRTARLYVRSGRVTIQTGRETVEL